MRNTTTNLGKQMWHLFQYGQCPLHVCSHQRERRIGNARGNDERPPPDNDEEAVATPRRPDQHRRAAESRQGRAQWLPVHSVVSLLVDSRVRGALGQRGRPGEAPGALVATHHADPTFRRLASPLFRGEKI